MERVWSSQASSPSLRLVTATAIPASLTPSQVPIRGKVPSGPWSAPASRQRSDPAPMRQQTGDVIGRRRDSSRLAPIITGAQPSIRKPMKTRHMGRPR